VVAAVYAVLAIVVGVIDPPLGDILQGTLYLVILLHGLIVNQSWLLLLWGRRENGQTIFGTRTPLRAPTGPRQRAAAMSPEAEKLLAGAGTDRSDYLASADEEPRPRRKTRAQRRAEAAAARARAAAAPAEATRPRPASAAPASTPRAPAVPAAVPTSEQDLVDVNTANQRTIAKLPGMDRGRAKAAISERTKRGGFTSLDDFAATAGLQPHEIARLRSAAFCSPRPRAARTFGRRVDF
jgi:DNA uptake protein ComE-like DNA-binding protein